MIRFLDFKASSGVLGSPAGGPLEQRGDQLVCHKTGLTHPVRNHIIEFVDIARLDAEKARELRGNTIALNPEIIELYANKHSWSDFYSHFTRQKIRRLVEYLNRIGSRDLVALGCGTGYELRYLLNHPLMDVKRIYASDLSYSMLSVVPRTLRDFDVEVCLFTSDLDQCPVEARDIPVLIYEALHHTEDMHATIDHLMSKGFQDILFVEPTSNPLMRFLERFGLARRVEYSGVKPDRLMLPRLKSLCRTWGYRMSRESVWEVPEDHFRKICPWKGWPQSLLLSGLKWGGAVASWFMPGNTSVVHLHKVGTAVACDAPTHEPMQKAAG